MKKLSLLLFVAVLTTGFAANAQIQKGNVLIGGNLANLDLGLDKPSRFSASIEPKAAWFVQDNIALGGYVKFGIETVKNNPTTTDYGVGALGRYYAGSDTEVIRHGRFFGEAAVGLGGQNVSGDNGANTNGLDFSFGPGFAYFITPNIGLEALLKYNGLAGFGDTNFQNKLALSFGFQIYLPGRGTASKVKSDVQ
jgi:hypothetical protein